MTQPDLVELLRQAIVTIATYPITDPGNQDAVNMARIADETLDKLGATPGTVQPEAIDVEPATYQWRYKKGPWQNMSPVGGKPDPKLPDIEYRPLYAAQPKAKEG